ncbi:hypothetical protein GW17_00037987 [Ensete ventricosum]|nr:hypothetical protein GW17_00037987 [Ensete ventricosum]
MGRVHTPQRQQAKRAPHCKDHGRCGRSTTTCLVSSPDRKDRHGSGADEEGGVGRHLKPHTAANPPAQEVGGYQIDQCHVDQNARRHRVEQPLHHQRSWAVGVEGRRDAGPRRDPRRRRDGEEARHDCRSKVTELRLSVVAGRIRVQNAEMNESSGKRQMATWEMHPPKAKPSKNWWKERAATSGLMVQGLRETPSERPMITEWEMIPSSRI